MRLEPFGPWHLANRFDVEWLLTSQAAKCFFISSLVVIAFTPLFLGHGITLHPPAWLNLLTIVLVTVGPFAIFFVWFGMWRFWSRLDTSSDRKKRFWFIILLIGFWWGSCIYCWCVYLPRVARDARIQR
jgi:hypothetical protein